MACGGAGPSGMRMFSSKGDPQEIYEGSNKRLLNQESSSEPRAKDNEDNRGFNISSPAVLENSKDKWRRSGEAESTRGSKKVLNSSCPQLLNRENLSISVDEPEDEHESEEEQQSSGGYQNCTNQQANNNEPHTSFWTNFKYLYNHYARNIRNSWFIYVFQFFVGALSASGIFMGMLFFQGCEGRANTIVPFLTIFMSVSQFPVIYKWVKQVCRERSGQRYWNSERNLIFKYLILSHVLILVEFLAFCSMGPKDLQSIKEIKCNRIFYTYLYFLNVSIAGCLGLAGLLYLPDAVNYIKDWDSPEPTGTNGVLHYDRL